jgi:pre-peptidase/HYR domain-containing protein
MKYSSGRLIFLACLAVLLTGLVGWTLLKMPGAMTMAAHAQSESSQRLANARAALEQAQANERANPTKENAEAVDAALAEHELAVSTRVAEITAALRELAMQAENSGKTSPIVDQIETLEAELGQIQPIAGPTPAVTLETEPNGTPATANTINLSGSAQPCAVVAAAINPGGDVDFFTFTGAPAGSRIWIETDTGGTQNPGATSRDTVIDLLAADGVTVIENDDDDGTGNGGDGTIETGLASMIGGRTLTAGGTYFIRVRAFSATGIVNPYRMFVTLTNMAATPEVEANNTAATANPITTGSGQIGLRSGSVSPASDSDYYSVAATAGNIVYFNTDADPERDGTGTDLVVELRSPTDTLLLSVDSSITGSLANPAAEGANFTINTSGTYFVRVRHFSATGTGTYHLMVSTCSGATGSGCTITCPPNITQSNDAGQCGAVVNYPAPSTTGSCGTVTCSPPSGSFFPAGTTTVTCMTTAGPSCSFTVTVNQDTPAATTIAAGPATLVTESCPPANSAIDPGERVTVNLELHNTGGCPTTNLVATLVPGGGVSSPSLPQSYGALTPTGAGSSATRDFSFTASGVCGGSITATWNLSDGPTNLGTVTKTFTLGCTTPCGIVRLVTTSTISRFNATTVKVTYQVKNIGTIIANDVTLTSSKLGATNGGPLPQFIGDLPPDIQSPPFDQFFTNSTPGVNTTLKLDGTYTGGTFSSTKRVTIP